MRDEAYEWAVDSAGEVAELSWAQRVAALTLSFREALKKGHEDGAQWMLRAITGTLRDYPNGGGDTGVMGEVERIRKEAFDAGFQAGLRENNCPLPNRRGRA